VKFATRIETFDASVTGNPHPEMLVLDEDIYARFEMAGELHSNAGRCLMSFKLLQFPPQTSTRSTPAPLHWVNLDERMEANGFLSSWLDDGRDSNHPQRRMNWGAAAGIAISLVVSACVWAGVGVLVARLLR